MYALQPPTQQPRKRTTPNLLPCTIHHNGPIPNTTSRYWSPTTTASASPTDRVAKKTSYLRGRKLQGRALPLPAGYTGLVLQKTDKLLPVKRRIPTAEELRAMEEDGEDDEGLGNGEEQAEEVKVLEARAEFGEIVVWGHEAAPEDDDVYVRGVEEWIGFAEAMHCDDKPITSEVNGTT